MTNRIGGDRRKTRRLMSKQVRQHGKISLSSYLANYKPGDKVLLCTEPAIQRGSYNPRFHGRIATVTGKRGECYELEFKDLNKTKQLIIHPIHLRHVK